MSQEKVNRYKEEKANRKAKMRRDRFKSMIRKMILLVLSVALVGWVVYSAIDTYQANRPRDMVTVNYESITNYLQALGEEAVAETPVDILEDPGVEDDEVAPEEDGDVEGEGDTEGEGETEEEDETVE